jgi:uncharacterized membrane protein
MHPWELHPVLIHFPIAFLLGGLLVDLFARFHRRESLTRMASGLLTAGVLSGIAAAVAGVISYFTVPAHTEAAHEQMDTHLVLAGAALVLFAVVAIARWRHRTQPASMLTLSTGLMGAALLIGAAFLGGKIVYEGGAGVDPQILAPAVVQGHHHHHHDGADDEGADHDHMHTDAPGEDDHAHADELHEHQHGSSVADDHQQHAHPAVAGRNAPKQRAPLFDPDEDLKQPLR